MNGIKIPINTTIIKSSQLPVTSTLFDN